MLTKPIIGLIAAVVVIGGGYGVYRSMHSGVAPTVATSTDATTHTAQPSGKKMAFSEFMKQGGSYQCTVHQSVANVDTTGTVYLDSGKLKGEFTTNVQGQNIDAHFVIRDGFTYVWNSMMANRGFKIPVTEPTMNNTGAPASGTYGFDAQQIGDYDCKPWTADQAIFALPSGVTFTDLKAQVQ